MAISQPSLTSKTNSPDHSLMHRQIATDPSAGVKTIAIDSNSHTYIGDYDGGNYFKIAGDTGELSLAGNARVKIPIKIFTSAELQRGLTPPSSGALGNFAFEQYTIDDDSILNLAVFNRRESGTDIEVIIRWAVDETYAYNSAEVQWQIKWSAIPDDGSIAIDNPTYSGTVESGDVNIPTIAKSKKETIIKIPGTNISNTDGIGFTLKRIALDGGNNPVEEPGITLIAIVITSNKLGELI